VSFAMCVSVCVAHAQRLNRCGRRCLPTSDWLKRRCA
jgi:hypothetical protein